MSIPRALRTVLSILVVLAVAPASALAADETGAFVQPPVSAVLSLSSHSIHADVGPMGATAADVRLEGFMGTVCADGTSALQDWPGFPFPGSGPRFFTCTWNASAAADDDFTLQLWVDNGAGLTHVGAADRTVTLDGTEPVGGSITPPNGEQTGTTANIAFALGTEAHPGSFKLERRSATLTGSTCGTFGDFATAVLNLRTETSPYADTGLMPGMCYQYRAIDTDQAGNETIYLSDNVVKVLAPVDPAVLSVTPSGTMTLANAVRGAATASKTVTLTNTGGANATGLTVTMTSSTGTPVNARFTFTETCPPTLVPDTSCTATVRYNPQISNLGLAKLIFTSAGATGSPKVVNVQGRGTCETGTSAAVRCTERTVGGLAGLTYTGTAGTDVVMGSVGPDEINGLAGNDRLLGKNGNDTIKGGDGNDTISGGNNNDTLFVGVGPRDAADRETVCGGLGVDTIHATRSGLGVNVFTNRDNNVRDIINVYPNLVARELALRADTKDERRNYKSGTPPFTKVFASVSSTAAHPSTC